MKNGIFVNRQNLIRRGDHISQGDISVRVVVKFPAARFKIFESLYFLKLIMPRFCLHCKVIIGRNPIEASANTVAIQLPGNPVAYIGKCFTPY